MFFKGISPALGLRASLTDAMALQMAKPHGLFPLQIGRSAPATFPTAGSFLPLHKAVA